MRQYGIIVAMGLLVVAQASAAQAELRVGFAEADITPDLTRPVWIAGYGHGRKAAGVHDPIMARGLVLADGSRKVALVCADVVGLQYPAVQKIRAKLLDYHYVMVSSTHNHEGPDVIGIWGATPFQSGVDAAYIDLVIERVVSLVRACEKNLAPAKASYGTAQDDTLLGDSRLPIAFDGVLRVVRFDAVGDSPSKSRRTSSALGPPPSAIRDPSSAIRPATSALGLLVQWNCHPESLGSKNTQLTADFVFATVARLKERYGCPVAYFSGAVGGLMAPPDNRVRNAEGQLLPEGDFEYARVYGELVANLAEKAADTATPVELTPFASFARLIAVPLANPMYQAARALGVLNREGRIWTGDFEQLGPIITPENAKGATISVETEVAYLRLGELHVACIPGELYPELVYGRFQDPVEPGADFPDAPLETPVMKLLPGDKTLVIGLANDEIGYIIPKRQWDDRPPFAYGRNKSQYGEINSCGPEIAPIVMKALEKRVKEASLRP